jgi:hypothetical protein
MPTLEGTSEGQMAVPGAFHATTADGDGDPFTDALSEFKGGAATLRFTGDGLEFAMAGDAGSPELSDLSGTTGGELVRRLPDDTAAAAGISLQKGWLSRQVDSMSLLFGAGLSREDFYREISQETGLDAPDDIETLLGSGVAFSVGSDIDFEALENTDDGTGIPVAATVKGDPDAIGHVLDKLRSRSGDLPFLGSDASGDLAVIGPTDAYRQRVLAGGDLGDDDAFRSVVPEAEHASSIFYVNVDALEPAITKLAVSADSEDDLDNVTPLRAVGMSSWTDSGVTRFSFKVTTN